MKNSLLLIGAVAVILISTVIRSQEPADNVEALLKVDEAVPVLAEPEVEAVEMAEAVLEEVAEAAVEVADDAIAAAAEAVVQEEEVAVDAVEQEPETAAVEAVAALPVEEAFEVVDVVLVDESAPSAEGSVLGDGTISITLDDTPIAEVIKLFSQLSGANIIAATSNLTGTISANLNNVAWQPAFEAILGRHELILSEKPAGSGIYVVESSRAGEEPSVTETIPLKYAKATDMADLVNRMQGNAASAIPFADGNAILVKVFASKLADVRKVVDSLDVAPSQVYIEARFVEMSAAASKKLGINWEMFNEWSAGISKINAGAEWNRGKLARYDTRTTEIQNIGGVDTPVSVALIPDEINDASLAGRSADDMAWRMARGISGQMNMSDLRVTLSAFEQEDGVSVISNPKIIVANEREATVDMTTKEPYVEVEFQPSTTDNGRDTTSTKLATIPGKSETFVGEAFFSYGVSLKVKPRISKTGVISVDIEPSISEKINDFVIQGADKDLPMTSYPIINMKKIKTTFSMLDGSTAVIGGLTRSGETNVDSGIPLLRHIPWVGPRLFGWKSRSKTQSEIIIFVTVGVMNSEEDMPLDIGLPKNAVLSRDLKEPGDLPREDVMKLKK